MSFIRTANEPPLSSRGYLALLLYCSFAILGVRGCVYVEPASSPAGVRR